METNVGTDRETEIIIIRIFEYIYIYVPCPNIQKCCFSLSVPPNGRLSSAVVTMSLSLFIVPFSSYSSYGPLAAASLAVTY